MPTKEKEEVAKELAEMLAATLSDGRTVAVLTKYVIEHPPDEIMPEEEAIFGQVAALVLALRAATEMGIRVVVGIDEGEAHCPELN